MGAGLGPGSARRDQWHLHKPAPLDCQKPGSTSLLRWTGFDPVCSGGPTWLQLLFQLFAVPSPEAQLPRSRRLSLLTLLSCRSGWGSLPGRLTLEDTFALSFPKLSLWKLSLGSAPSVMERRARWTATLASEAPRSCLHHSHAPIKGGRCWPVPSHHTAQSEFTAFKQAGGNICGFVI